MSDLISRQAVIDKLDEYLEEYAGVDGEGMHSEKWCAMAEAKMVIKELQSAQPEPLTDKEQRIFLAAMAREEKVCKQVDIECRNCREPYEDSLVRTCHKITRKVKGALWRGK